MGYNCVIEIVLGVGSMYGEDKSGKVCIVEMKVMGVKYEIEGKRLL